MLQSKEYRCPNCNSILKIIQTKFICDLDCEKCQFSARSDLPEHPAYIDRSIIQDRTDDGKFYSHIGDEKYISNFDIDKLLQQYKIFKAFK